MSPQQPQLTFEPRFVTIEKRMDKYDERMEKYDLIITELRNVTVELKAKAQANQVWIAAVLSLGFTIIGALIGHVIK